MSPRQRDPAEIDGHFMQMAIEEARQALGRTAPNPSVGALVVRDGVVLGAGRTQPVGGPHAEVEAIRAAREAGHELVGATLYVTLEPCCHWGRTPPCTDAILSAGLSRVVVGVVDPYPPMRGKGLSRLRAKGVEVLLGVEAVACAEVVLGFTRTLTKGLPEVTSKVACSLDGRIATSTGESQWITGALARRDGHGLRASHDAILVGIGTAIADDPRLTCRDGRGPDPVPVVLDTELRLPLEARLLTAGRPAVVVCADDAPRRALPAEVIRVPRASAGGVDPVQALRALAAQGLHRVLIEGGAGVHRTMIEARLVDTLHLYLAPMLIPGGRGWIAEHPALSHLGDARRFGAPAQILPLDSDVRLTWRLDHRLDHP
ncbi:MAG: bifunctional diaminohydroxyphosphoribosylaminopyrimidine deaminase/5-amino-6-(5-phosphoribosylamino)uracil reductase RibD [Deltaproteobacteria bacterium]|nr:MAG: bifunctional diaminohydroxyphosphoribosylaminopyrimidine deaminase/5-amino-6-(5-phosphoribosylamino)uracil reductase RibD [Deltaproteobacteria bacterium]